MTPIKRDPQLKNFNQTKEDSRKHDQGPDQVVVTMILLQANE